jgi:hypothetical protein
MPTATRTPLLSGLSAAVQRFGTIDPLDGAPQKGFEPLTSGLEIHGEGGLVPSYAAKCRDP